MVDSTTATTEPTVHLLEITDPGQLESLRASGGFPEGVELRAFTVVYTFLNRAGVLSLVAPPAGYGLWVNTVEGMAALFEQEGELILPSSMPWSEAPEWITGEFQETEDWTTGEAEESFNFVADAGDRPTAIQLDWRG